MAAKQEFARQIEAQVQVWQAQIKEHQERMDQAGAEAKAGYDKALAQLRANAEEAGKLLRQVQDSNRPPGRTCRRRPRTRSRASSKGGPTRFGASPESRELASGHGGAALAAVGQARRLR